MTTQRECSGLVRPDGLRNGNLRGCYQQVMEPDSLNAVQSAESQQLDRVLQSSVLHGSETLRRLLRYLAGQSLHRPGVVVKEQQIAQELLGKGQNFDPQLDPTVRVQIGRLRTKLVEYYAAEGLTDDIVIEIPRGAYGVSFRHRPPHPEPAESPAPPAIAKARESGPLSARAPLRRWWPVIAAASVLTVVALYGASRMWTGHRPYDQPGASLRMFWKVFDSPNPPLVVFSNGPFVGNPVLGMRYFDPSKDAGKDVLDHYTGVGEVLAIHELDSIFFAMGRDIVIQRGRLLNWDETKHRGVIFVGSPSENLNLKEVPYEREFEFRTMDNPDRTQGIWNLHPRPGESAVYAATGTTSVSVDYGLVSLMSGFGDTHPILLLAGTTTFGTQGTVEFVCREANVSGLLSHFKNGTPVPFSAVVRVKVSGGVPVSFDLVTLHLVNPGKTN